MPQPNQTPVLVLNPVDNSFNSHFPAGDKPSGEVHYHGDVVSIPGSFTAFTPLSSTFLGGADGLLETTTLGSTPPNNGNWIFNQTSGYPLVTATDSVRGTVLYGHEDSSNYDSASRYQFPGGGVPANTWLYQAHYGRIDVKRSGVRYDKWWQTKLTRLNYQNDLTDTDPCQLRAFVQGPKTNTNPAVLAGPAQVVGSYQNGTMYYGDSTNIPSQYNDWFLLEQLIYTGTPGAADGKEIVRVHQKGVSKVLQNVTGKQFYNGDGHLFNFYIEQYYMGNWNLHVASAKATVTGAAANNTVYSFTYTSNTGGTKTVSYTSSGSATATEIINGLYTVANSSHAELTVSVTGGTTLNIARADLKEVFTHTQVGLTIVDDTVIDDGTIGVSPDFREVYRDDTQLIVCDGTSVKRVDISDTLSTQACTKRENSKLVSWGTSAVSAKLNAGGLPAGNNTMYMRVIDGVDVNGWDNVIAYKQIVVHV